MAAPVTDHERQIHLARVVARNAREHAAVAGDEIELAVVLPQREGVALLERNFEPPGIELAHGSFGDARVALQPRPRAVGVDPEQRSIFPDAGGVEHLGARQALGAGDLDRLDAEAGGVGERVADVGHRLDHRVGVAAAHDAVGAGGGEQRDHRNDLGAAQQARFADTNAGTMEEENEAAGRCALDRLRRLAPGIQRSREASSKIHFTSSPNERPA